MRVALRVGGSFRRLIGSTRGRSIAPDPSLALPENALSILGAWERPRVGLLTRPLNAVAIAAIFAYRRAVSRGRVPPACCLHYPSCSAYAILAFRKYRFLDAARRARARVADCGASSARPFVDFP